jgi:hypothetical protein
MNELSNFQLPDLAMEVNLQYCSCENHRTKMVDLFAMFDDWGDKLSELKQT